MEIRVHATLREKIGSKSVHVDSVPGMTVGQALEAAMTVHPALRSALFDEEGRLNPSMHVMVNGRDVRFVAGLDTPVQDGDDLRIFPPVGGGARRTGSSPSDSGEAAPAQPGETAAPGPTRVTLKFTGDVRQRMGSQDRIEFAFAGNTLGALLAEVFAQYDLRDLILNEQGEVRPWARVAVNGRFSYLVGNMEAPIREGDLVALIYPYSVAF